MKVCRTYSDTISEEIREKNPTDLFCDECYKDMNIEGEENPTIFSRSGDRCSQCGKTVEEEREEQNL